jgi:hypothetical protein
MGRREASRYITSASFSRPVQRFHLGQGAQRPQPDRFVAQLAAHVGTAPEELPRLIMVAQLDIQPTEGMQGVVQQFRLAVLLL